MINGHPSFTSHLDWLDSLGELEKQERCYLCGNLQNESEETKLLLVKDEKICKGCLMCEDCAEDVARVFNPYESGFAYKQFNERGHRFDFWHPTEIKTHNSDRLFLNDETN